MRRFRHLVVAATAILLAAGAGLGQPLDLRLEALNRVYQDVAGEFPPLDLSPVVVRLSSPHQSILLKQNRIRLERLDGARFAARVELDLLGKGDLIADVEFAGSTRQLTDELLVPRQTLAVEGIVQISRVGGGFRVVTEKLPRDLAVAIRSRLVGQVLELCGGAALLTFGQIDCDAVAAALENPRVPLPGPGFEYLLADRDLDAEQVQALEALLAGS